MNELNLGRNIVSVFDDSFKRFGVVHKSFKIDTLLDYIKRNNIITDDMVYIADVPEMRKELKCNRNSQKERSCKNNLESINKTVFIKNILKMIKK